MITAVDTSVLLDILGADPVYGAASRDLLQRFLRAPLRGDPKRRRRACGCAARSAAAVQKKPALVQQSGRG
jgi:hypothetical protein